MTRNADDDRPVAETATADKDRLDALMPGAYGELHDLAERLMRPERADHTLQPTALVNEAYLKLVRQRQGPLERRSYFFACAAGTIRRLLIDHARRHGRRKRGGSRWRVTLSPELVGTPGGDLDLLALNEALDRLAEVDERHARVVELRFFGGLTVPEVAEVLGVSVRTVEADWTLSRAWLHRELTRS